MSQVRRGLACPHLWSRGRPSRRGKVKHSMGLYVHPVLNAGYHFSLESRKLREGHQRRRIEKRSHLSSARLEEEEKKNKTDDFSPRVAIAACLGLISLHFSSPLIKTKACMLRKSIKEWERRENARCGTNFAAN